MNSHTIGDDPRLREILSELQNLIALAERVPWTPAEARGIVEALRLGIPPAGATVRLTVGRESVLARISHELDDVGRGKPRLAFLKGEYGMGKTHTLHVFQEYAHQHSFASSHIELSLRECPLHDLGLVYRKIVRNLQTKPYSPGSALALLLGEWADHIRRIGEHDRRMALQQLGRLDSNFRAALTAYFACQQGGRIETSVLALEWLAGGRLSVSERSAIGVSASVSQANALSMLGNLAAMLRLLGIRGIVVLLDEADRSLSFEGAAERAKAVRNLNLLMRSSGSFPCSYFVYSAPPSFFQRRDILSGITIQPQNVIDLQPLEPKHLVDLACKIRDLHLLAYTWQNQPRVRDSEIRHLANRLLQDELLRSSVRAFVRAMMEVLDCCQQDTCSTVTEVIRHLEVTPSLT